MTAPEALIDAFERFVDAVPASPPISAFVGALRHPSPESWRDDVRDALRAAQPPPAPPPPIASLRFSAPLLRLALPLSRDDARCLRLQLQIGGTTVDGEPRAAAAASPATAAGGAAASLLSRHDFTIGTLQIGLRFPAERTPAMLLPRIGPIHGTASKLTLASPGFMNPKLVVALRAPPVVTLRLSPRIFGGGLRLSGAAGLYKWADPTPRQQTAPVSSLEVSAEIDELRLQIHRPATLPAARPAEPTDFTGVGGGGGGAPSAAGGGEGLHLATLCLGGLTFRANGTPFSETRHLQIAVASVALDDAREGTHPAVARLATVVASLPPWPPPPAATPARAQ